VNKEERRNRLADLLRTESLERGHFVLASGRTSDYYLDCRRTTLHPEGAYLVGQLLLSEIEERGWGDARAVGGLTLGADPVATAVAIASYLEGRPRPAFLVRKEAKEHGTQRRIERCPEPGTPVVVLEDVVTTGGSALAAAQACLDAGLVVLGVLGIVDREEGGREAFSARKLEHGRLFTARELLERRS
jgi:orotate phosphoribosyltransferase